MIIGFYFNDLGFSELDLSHPLAGNNGIGGTQYCFILLADALLKYTNNQVIFYHYNENVLPDGTISKLIGGRDEIIDRAIDDKIDVLLFKAEGVSGFVKALNSSNLHAVPWAHNYLYSEELTEYCNNPAISRVVFVGHEMYDRYIDHPIRNKATYIYNMFDGRVFNARPMPKVPVVSYTGSLVPAKGFHILAKVWKEIIKEVPNAQLYVIGDGKLYDRNAELGAYGIAQKSYEDQFMPHLTVDGDLMDSVHFLGTMGKEKLEIYEKTTVGVMNPTGRTETFGLSAIEMSACGIPVVTKRANGLYDTVIDGETGYLIKSKKELANRIIRLLTDNRLNDTMGKNGKKFADTAFLPENIVKQWESLFEEIKEGRQTKEIAPSKHYANNAKWLRIINHKIRNAGIHTKPIVDLECMLRKMISHH